MKTKITAAAILILAVFCFFSCDATISLGKKLNLEPPVVTIEKPDFMENVSGNLEISGTASDLEEVVFLFVTMEKTKGEEWKREWIGERGNWQSRTHNSDSWTNVSGAWKSEAESEEIFWSVTIDMDGAPEGEYLITARAKNNVSNEGAVDQRRVVIDNTPPAVSILVPVLEFDDHDSNIKYTYINDVLPAFDLYALKDPAVLSKLHNQQINIQYEIKDEFSIDYLILQLADEKGSVFYNKDAKAVENLSWGGRHVINEKDIKDPDTGDPITQKMYLQLISAVSDKAGNEKIQSHGWLVWWPEADIPWIEGGGDDVAPGNFELYIGSDIQLLAYDDDGVKSLTYAIYKQGSQEVYAANTVENIPHIEGGTPSAFFAHLFTVPDESGDYRIVIECEDINNPPLKSVPVTRYFRVLDPTPDTPLLLSFDGSPTGTYVTGNTINITLNFRGNINVTGGAPRLQLNVGKTPPSNAYTTGFTGNGTSKLTFSYTVIAGDNVPALEITGIDFAGSVFNEAGSSINTELLGLMASGTTSTGQKLSSFARIVIDTSSPSYQNKTDPTLINPKLVLNFSKEIGKGAGNITIEQTGPRLAPAVMSRADYLLFGGDSILGTYYERGTNGARQAGGVWEADTTEQYVLRYSYDTNNTTLVGLLAGRDIARGAFKVTVPVASGAVQVSADRKSLEIDLGPGWNYEPRVKGVTYAVRFDSGIVRDQLGNPVAALAGDAESFTNPGVNKPVIRVNKSRETFTPATFPAATITVLQWQWVTMIEHSLTERAGWARTNMGLYLNSDGYYCQDNRPGHGGRPGDEGEEIRAQGGTNYYWVRVDFDQPFGWLEGDENGNQHLAPNRIKLDVDFTYTSSDTLTTVAAVQPPAANVKIDCQTPAAAIRYTVNRTDRTPQTGTDTSNATRFNQTAAFSGTNPSHPAVSMPGASSTAFSTPFTLDVPVQNNGYLYGIRAEAAIGGVTATANEIAARSVIRFTNIDTAANWGALGGMASTNSRALQLWIRGGDSHLGGDNSTPGFPLKWKDSELDGIRLMTKEPASEVRYWVTWEVNVPAYFHFIAGTTASANAEAEARKGPLNWTWAKNDWAFQYVTFPLFPGGSLEFSRETAVINHATDEFEFYGSWSGSRP